MPFLLRALELPDNDIRANVIDTLATSADDALQEPNFVSEHASTLVSTMLKNSLVEEMPSVVGPAILTSATNPDPHQRVRIAALRYLSILPKLVRYDILHPHKSKAIRVLAKVLDDPKRSVRKEAVDAR